MARFGGRRSLAAALPLMAAHTLVEKNKFERRHGSDAANDEMTSRQARSPIQYVGLGCASANMNAATGTPSSRLVE
ncbi:hypothetical protein EVG20_g7985 [Dentipellis fragilis]|uniref:Uncharacterized protein n=1 Tax=Dentipellis fragilis TaxID=205917 RepID=A0A4Y9Y8N7_9AGAM|nr:hypothetical protein EVG20_g7985 [Dentipellis fragilis]